MPSTTHPACGKSYPANNRHGHCSRCHETFVGDTAFAAHWITTTEGQRTCTHPSALHGPWWTDDAGHWHRGHMTDEQRERLRARREASPL